MMLRVLKPLYQFVTDVIDGDDLDNALGYYPEQLDVAKLIVQRVGAAPDIPWPADSRQFLVLSAELATCTLVAERAQLDSQPGLPHLLTCLGHEANHLPTATLPSDAQWLEQQMHLGVIRYAAIELEAYDRLARAK
jgi:hypothetical protein